MRTCVCTHTHVHTHTWNKSEFHSFKFYRHCLHHVTDLVDRYHLPFEDVRCIKIKGKKFFKVYLLFKERKNPFMTTKPHCHFLSTLPCAHWEAGQLTVGFHPGRSYGPMSGPLGVSCFNFYNRGERTKKFCANSNEIGFLTLSMEYETKIFTI